MNALYLDCQGRFEGAERSGSRGRPVRLHAILRQPERNGRLPFLEDWLLGLPSWAPEIPYQVRLRQITLLYIENREYRFRLQNSRYILEWYNILKFSIERISDIMRDVIFSKCGPYHPVHYMWWT